MSRVNIAGANVTVFNILGTTCFSHDLKAGRNLYVVQPLNIIHLFRAIIAWAANLR